MVKTEKVLRCQQQRSAADGFERQCEGGEPDRYCEALGGIRTPTRSHIHARPRGAHVHEVEADEADCEHAEREALGDQTRSRSGRERDAWYAAPDVRTPRAGPRP